MPPPRKLPRISGREAIRVLEKLGFEVVRRRGSHVVLCRGSSSCVVPDHRELSTGTLLSADAYKTVLAALDNPPEPTEELREALALHRARMPDGG